MLSVARTVTDWLPAASPRLVGVTDSAMLVDASSLSVMVNVAEFTENPTAVPPNTTVSPVPSSTVSSSGSMLTVAVALAEPDGIVIDGSVVGENV